LIVGLRSPQSERAYQRARCPQPTTTVHNYGVHSSHYLQASELQARQLRLRSWGCDEPEIKAVRMKFVRILTHPSISSSFKTSGSIVLYPASLVKKHSLTYRTNLSILGFSGNQSYGLDNGGTHAPRGSRNLNITIQSYFAERK